MEGGWICSIDSENNFLCLKLAGSWLCVMRMTILKQTTHSVQLRYILIENCQLCYKPNQKQNFLVVIEENKTLN